MLAFYKTITVVKLYYINQCEKVKKTQSHQDNKKISSSSIIVACFNNTI